MNSQNTNIHKIKSYFNGQLSAEDEKQLYRWLKEDEKNLALFEAEKHKLDPKNIHHKLLDGSLAELKLKLQLNSQFNSEKKSGKKVFLRISRIAAIFILIVGLSFAFSMIINQFDSSNSEIVWFETTAPRGEKSKINLPDGSVVWLNAETTIRYPSNFTNNNRQIELHGEAYFEVEEFNDAAFSVKTNDYTISVLGTKFNVMAYHDFGRTQTSLIEGKVQIKKDGKTIDIKPGEEITYNENKFTIRKKNTEQSMAWKDNKFHFDKITVKELVRRLEYWYDVDIIITEKELPEIIYSGVFKNEETIWQVLDALKLTMPVDYKRLGFRKIELIYIK